VLNMNFSGPGVGPPGAPRAGSPNGYVLNVRMRLADVIVKQDKALAVSRKMLQRITEAFGKSYKIETISEPASGQAGLAFTGSLGSEVAAAATGKDHFYTEIRITKVGP
jgi:hypothetical protein